MVMNFGEKWWFCASRVATNHSSYCSHLRLPLGRDARWGDPCGSVVTARLCVKAYPVPEKSVVKYTQWGFTAQNIALEYQTRAVTVRESIYRV